MILEHAVQEAIWGGVAVFIRIGAALFLLPVFGENVIPLRVRLALAMALALLVSPLVDARLSIDSLGSFLTILFTETIAGLVFGALLRLLVWALEVVGMIAAQSIGIAQIFGASAATEASPVLAQFLVFTALALLCALNWPVQVVEYLVASYELWPLGKIVSAGMGLEAFLDALTASFALAMQLATPFYVLSLLYNTALGVISRAFPQLMVALIGAPAIAGLGIVLTFAAMPLLLQVWVEALP